MTLLWDLERQPSLLVIEDDETVIKLLRRGFEYEGANVVTTNLGGEGINLYSTRSFDLVILDVRLPGMDGYEVLNAIRAIDSSVPVFFWTSNDDLFSKIQGFEGGADDYITKPFNLDELILRVKIGLKHRANILKTAAKKEKPIANIFISYARVDIDTVQVIYNILKKNYNPWLDVYSINGGEDWLRAINTAIDECSVFLAILSSNSVSKRGVIQKELKKALDKWEEMLPDDIYIIPVRIDNCPIPDLLKHIQVLDWNNGKGESKLLKAIQVGLARRKNG